MRLDRAAEILTWPVAELDPLRLSLRMQVWRIVFMIGAKAYLDGALGPRRWGSRRWWFGRSRRELRPDATQRPDTR